MCSNTKNEENLPTFDLENISKEVKKYVLEVLVETQSYPSSKEKFHAQIFRFLERTADIITHEGNLINYRMMWMLTFQGFLIAAVTLQNKDTVLHPTLRLVICILGIVMVLISQYTIGRGLKAVSTNFQNAECVKKFLSDLFPDIAIYPVAGRRSPAAKWMQLSEKTQSKYYDKFSCSQIVIFHIRHFLAAWRSVPAIIVIFWLTTMYLYYGCLACIITVFCYLLLQIFLDA